MTRRKTGKPIEKKQHTGPLTLKAMAPQVDQAAEYSRQKMESVLRRVESLDSARELLGCEIVAAMPDGVKRVRIIKTRSFSGISKSTTNRDGILMEAGNVYIMKFRVAKFLNITTGRGGKPSCVWIEEATDMDTGKTLKSNQLLKALGLEESDGKPIFTDRTAIVPGAEPLKIERLSPSANRASENTTGIFQAYFSKEDAVLGQLGSAVDAYTNGKG